MNNLNRIAGIVLGVLLITNLLCTYYVQRRIEDSRAYLDFKMNTLESQIQSLQNAISDNNGPGDALSETKEVMSPSELATYLNIDMHKIYAMAKDPKSGIPFVMIDGEYRFSKQAVDQWLASQKKVEISQ